MKLPANGGFDDFSYATKTRKDRILVSGRAFFVNLGYLAEFSEFFADHFDDEQDIVVEGIDAFDFLELLRVLFNCPKKKSLKETNLVPVVNAACFFQIPTVLKRCEEVIQYCLHNLTHADLLQLTQTISRYDRENASLSILVEKIAHFNENELSTLPFSKIPGDVVADVYTLRQFSAERQSRERRDRKKRRFWSTETFCCFF